MEYRLINFPIQVTLDEYYSQINKILDFLSNKPSIKSVYRIGNITDPGISDVDLIVVFKDGGSLKVDPRSILDKTGRYLFAHQLFAINESLVKEFMKFSLYSNFQYLMGDEISCFDDEREVNAKIKLQIALEYLIKTFVSLSIQKEARIIKVRPFLLETNSLKYDLEITGNFNTGLDDSIRRILEIRAKWFITTLDKTRIAVLFEEIHQQLTLLLIKLAENQCLYVEQRDNIYIGRNIILRDGKTLKYDSSAFITGFARFLPSCCIPSYLKIFNRITNHVFYFPQKEATLIHNIASKSYYERQSLKFISECAPHFIALKSPLSLNARL